MGQEMTESQTQRPSVLKLTSHPLKETEMGVANPLRLLRAEQIFVLFQWGTEKWALTRIVSQLLWMEHHENTSCRKGNTVAPLSFHGFRYSQLTMSEIINEKISETSNSQILSICYSRSLQCLIFMLVVINHVPCLPC